MKLSDVKRRNRLIGVIGAALLFERAGLDPFLRRLGGVLFSFCVLLLLFFLAPLLLEYLERKFVR